MKFVIRGVSLLSVLFLALVPTGCGSDAASSPSTTSSAQVVQDAQNNYTFSWAPITSTSTTPTTIVQMTGGLTPSSIDGTTILGTATGGTVLTLSSLDTTHRWYFNVAQQGGTPTTVAVRHITFAAPVVNFRDLGGYQTVDGHRTKWGVFFRTDQLSNLTTADANYLVNSGITYDVDLRADTEVSAAPDTPATDGRFTYVREPISMPMMAPQYIFAHGTFDEAAMVSAYEQTLETYKTTFAHVFHDLAAHGAGSVFHCIYGKDRTGMVAALLLMAANVPDSTIVAEYNLTDQYEAVGEAAAVAQAAAAVAAGQMTSAQAAMLGVSYYAPPAVMQAVLTYIRQTYGSAGAYLQTGGLKPEELAKVLSDFVQ